MSNTSAQIDWIDQGGVLPLLAVGSIIKTNYNTGPYRIIDISEPCTCTEYLASLEGDLTPSEPHYHITCEVPGEKNRKCYWLNGYRADGTNVWSDDRLEGE